MNNMLNKAIDLTTQQFDGVFDRAGAPYILHCLEVMRGVDQTDSELMQIAVMHDLIEDTELTAQDLKEMGFSSRVLKALRLLTHLPSMKYSDYIRDISKNRDAIFVKLSDLRHNSDLTRLKSIKEKDLKRLAKYQDSYTFLLNSLGN